MYIADLLSTFIYFVECLTLPSKSSWPAMMTQVLLVMSRLAMIRMTFVIQEVVLLNQIQQLLPLRIFGSIGLLTGYLLGSQLLFFLVFVGRFFFPFFFGSGLGERECVLCRSSTSSSSSKKGTSRCSSSSSSSSGASSSSLSNKSWALTVGSGVGVGGRGGTVGDEVFFGCFLAKPTALAVLF